MENNIKNLVVENAKLIFKNFEGEKTQYNAAGKRNFCVIIDDPVLADHLMQEGWNLKQLHKRDEEDDDAWYIKVNVNFDSHSAPHVVLLTHHSKKVVTEDNLESCMRMLDCGRFANFDLVATPYRWEINGRTGVSAYLKSLYATVEEDEFADKYAGEEYPEE